MKLKTKIKLFFIKNIKTNYALSKPFFIFLGIKKSAMLITLSIVSSLAIVVSYISFIPVIKSFLGNEEVSFLFIRNITRLELVAFIVFSFIAKITITSLLSYYNAKCDAEYISHIQRQIQIQVNLKNFKSEDVSVAEVSFISGIVPRIDSFFWAIVQLVTKIILIVPILGLVIFLYFNFVIYIFIIGFAWFLLQSILIGLAKTYSEKFSETLSQHHSFFVDDFLNAELIHAHALRKSHFVRLESIRKEIINACSRTGLFKHLSTTVFEIILTIGAIALVLFPEFSFFNISEAASFGFLFSKLISNVSEISIFFTNATEQAPFIEKIYSFIGVLNKKSLDEVEKVPYLNLKTVRFESFKISRKETLILKDFNFNFNIGEIIHLKGVNGSGKSSLTKALMNLIPYEGKIFINETNYKELISNNQYLKIALNPQVVYLSNTTVIENIIEGTSLNKNDIVNFLKINEFKIDDKFIFREVKNNGQEFSGGQLQFISLLRAFVQDYDILILDEYTNHLSKELLPQINKYISEKLSNKIVLIISHEQLSVPSKIIELNRINA